MKSKAEIQKFITERRAELAKPHKCGRFCLCKVLHIKLDIIQIDLDKLPTEGKGEL